MGGAARPRYPRPCSARQRAIEGCLQLIHITFRVSKRPYFISPARGGHTSINKIVRELHALCIRCEALPSRGYRQPLAACPALAARAANTHRRNILCKIRRPAREWGAREGRGATADTKKPSLAFRAWRHGGAGHRGAGRGLRGGGGARGGAAQRRQCTAGR